MQSFLSRVGPGQIQKKLDEFCRLHRHGREERVMAWPMVAVRIYVHAVRDHFKTGRQGCARWQFMIMTVQACPQGIRKRRGSGWILRVLGTQEACRIRKNIDLQSGRPWARSLSKHIKVRRGDLHAPILARLARYTKGSRLAGWSGSNRGRN